MNEESVELRLKGKSKSYDFVKLFLKSLVHCIQSDTKDIEIYNETGMDNKDEIHVDCRDFTPESQCNDVNRYLILDKWHSKMHSYLYFNFLEPFFSTATLIKETKKIDWVRYSFKS